jgi:hypothetical protein
LPFFFAIDIGESSPPLPRSGDLLFVEVAELCAARAVSGAGEGEVCPVDAGW